MDKDIIEKYMEGLLTDDQIGEVLDRLETDTEFRKLFFGICADKAFGSLPDRFDSSMTFDESVLPRISGHKHAKGRKLFVKILRTAVSVAAVLFIPLCIYVFYDLATDPGTSGSAEPSEVFDILEDRDAVVTQTTNPGVKGLVELPDGSKAWLNSCSEIVFPVRFDSLSRAVRLSGEAFFDVVRNPSRPMFIDCGNGLSVKVTGTRFNITAYGDDDFRILLVSGSLDVVDSSRGKVYRVEPSQQLTIFDDKSLKPVKTLPDIGSRIAWKEGRLVFDNTAMPEVIRRLERWFGIKIIVKDDSILDYRFTATFGPESVTRVLDILKLSSSVDYTFDGNTVILGD